MERIENQHRNNNHDTLEHNKQRLVLDQRTVPPFPELDDAVDGADEDADGRQRQRDEKSSELHAPPEGRVGGIERGFAHAVRADNGPDGEVGAEEHEDQEGEDLEGKTGDHDVVARFGVLVGVGGGGGHAAAEGLEDEGEDVAGDEDARVREGFDAGVFRAKGDDDAGEGEVDAGGEEGGGDGEAAYLHEEAVLGRWLAVWEREGKKH